MVAGSLPRWGKTGHLPFLDVSGIVVLYYYNVINQVISYWTSYRSSVSCIGPRPNNKLLPRSNTADRGPVTGPIRNNLINEIFIN